MSRGRDVRCGDVYEHHLSHPASHLFTFTHSHNQPTEKLHVASAADYIRERAREGREGRPRQLTATVIHFIACMHLTAQTFSD